MDIKPLAKTEQLLNQAAIIPGINALSGSMRVIIGIVQVAMALLGVKTAVDNNFYAHGMANIARGLLECSYYPNLIFAAIYDGLLAKRFKYPGEGRPLPSVWHAFRGAAKLPLGFSQS